MTTNHHYATKPFRIGFPGLPGRANTRRVDPYAQRAITAIGDLLGTAEFLEPDDGIRILGLADKDEWRRDFVVVVLEQPWRPRLGEQEAISLEVLLARQGQTAQLQKVRSIIESDHRPINTDAILANEHLFRFAYARAYYTHGFEDAEGIASWMIDADDGFIAEAYPLVALTAIDDFVDRERVEVDVGGNRQAFEQAVLAEVTSNPVAFENGAFEAYIERFVDDFAFLSEPLAIIRQTSQAMGLNATDEEINYLARYFEQSPIELTQQNARDLVPGVLTQYQSTTSPSPVAASAVSAPLDFAVRYHTDTDDAAAVNANNVRCAAQLFYVMTLGDELGVFRATDLLITRKLGVGQVDVTSPQLLRDLQDYGFNDEFRDLVGGRTHQRTSPEERQMFYRQVFDLGDTQLLDGMVTNTDFTSLWSALMVETVRYIEKVEKSDEPESNVSRNAVAQVIDDLRYNLSTYCSGMAKVMTPIAYRELDFLIERVWKSQEIIDQLALHNSGSFWRAIERCLQEDTGHSIGLTALLKKAEFGHQILSAVADFSPQTVLDDQRWTNLVSTIEAFIITSEQVDVDHGHDMIESGGPPGAYGAPVTNGTNGHATAPVDEWAF